MGRNKNSAPNVVAQKLQELKLDVSLNEQTGMYEFNNSRDFLIANGYASDQAVNLRDNDFLEHVPREEGAQIFDNYARLINYGNEMPGKNWTKRDDFGRSWFRFGENNSLYKSVIFMPLLDNGIATVTTNNELQGRDSYYDMLNRRNAVEASRNIRTQF